MNEQTPARLYAIAVGSLAASRLNALGLGVVYLALAAWGVAVGDGGVIAGLVPINTADTILHLSIGAVGVGAGLASSELAPAARATR